MKSKAYWADRQKKIFEGMEKDEAKLKQKLERLYNTEKSKFDKEVAAYYAQYGTDNVIAYRTLMQNLSSTDRDLLLKRMNDFGKQYPEYAHLLPVRESIYKLDRLEGLYTAIELQQLEIGAYEQALTKVHLEKWANSGYTEALGFGKNLADIASINNNVAKTLVNKKWIDSKNYSDRIWKNKVRLKNYLGSTFRDGVIRGDNYKKLVGILNEKFDTGKNEALRLIYTEGTFVINESNAQGFIENGYTKYLYSAILDKRTSDTCRGLHNKEFELEKRKPGENFPPMHPWCRSSFEVVIEGDEDTEETLDELTIELLEKLKNSGMNEEDYKEYLKILNNSSEDIKRLYKNNADNIGIVKKTENDGYYSSSESKLVFNYPNYETMNKYGTLAHEYGHYFDNVVNFKGLNFKEIDAIQDQIGFKSTFDKVASSSDEFLLAVRKDKEHIANIYTKELRQEMYNDHTSSGVQDAVDGLFVKNRILWGHGEKYYNRNYAFLKSSEKYSETKYTKVLQNIYKKLGLDASNQYKVKTICRQYEAASETWANIMSAEICGGDALEWVKKILPNSHKTMLEILKGVE